MSKFVAQASQPLRQQWPMIYIIHYTDDVFIAGKVPPDFLLCYRDLHQALTHKGLQIAPEKVKIQYSYNYLDFRLTDQAVFSQKIIICKDSLKNFK